MTETIAVIGFVQSLFGVLIFISKRPRHLCFTFLSIWLAINAIFLGAQLLPFQIVDYFKPGIFPILLLFGPLLYLYVSSLVVESFKLKPSQLLHLLPLVLVGIHRSTIDAVSVTSALEETEYQLDVYNKIYYFLIILSMFVYWVYSLRLILVHRKNIPFYFSNYSAKNTLTWLVSVVLIFLIFFVFNFFSSYLAVILKIDFDVFPGIIGTLTLFSFIMIFFGINQSVIYDFDKKVSSSVSETEQNRKYERSALSKNQIDEINNKVFNYLRTKRPYLNSEYSLQMMVDDLGISRQNMSQVINTGQKKNFYQLINEFRIEEVKNMLSDPNYSHYTVLGIAFECGFNSKTSFNRIFKEITGFTPTAYKKSL